MVTNIKGDQILEKLNGVKKPVTLEDWLRKMKPQLEKALPKHVNPDRILRIAMTSIRTNPKLRSCEPMSFLAALMQSAQLGLEPNTPLGEAYLIPYNSKTGMKVQFQIGYHGVITLSQNTGQYRSIYAHEVYEEDKFSYQLGLNKDLKHIPVDDPQGEPIYYYAVYHLLNGGFDFLVWSKKKVEKHRDQYSKSAKFPDSAWQTDFNAMAKKTLLIALLKYAPKSIELARQLAMDETIKDEVAPDMSEVPAEEFDITPQREEPIDINKKTGEVKEEKEEVKEKEVQEPKDQAKQEETKEKPKESKSTYKKKVEEEDKILLAISEKAQKAGINSFEELVEFALERGIIKTHLTEHLAKKILTTNKEIYDRLMKALEPPTDEDKEKLDKILERFKEVDLDTWREIAYFACLADFKEPGSPIEELKRTLLDKPEAVEKIIKMAKIRSEEEGQDIPSNRKSLEIINEDAPFPDERISDEGTLD